MRTATFPHFPNDSAARVLTWSRGCSAHRKLLRQLAEGAAGASAAAGLQPQPVPQLTVGSVNSAPAAQQAAYWGGRAAALILVAEEELATLTWVRSAVGSPSPSAAAGSGTEGDEAGGSADVRTRYSAAAIAAEACVVANGLVRSFAQASAEAQAASVEVVNEMWAELAEARRENEILRRRLDAAEADAEADALDGDLMRLKASQEQSMRANGSGGPRRG